MSTKPIYAIKDLAVQAFNVPFTARAKGEALRSFIDEVNNQESQLHKHPEDYELHHIADFDDQTGEIIPKTPELAARAKDVITTATA